jgi:hypothetical protein
MKDKSSLRFERLRFAIEQKLRLLPLGLRRAGKVLLNSQGLREIILRVPDIEEDGGYTVMVDFMGSRLRIGCTCSNEGSCVHIAAALTALSPELEREKERIKDKVKVDPYTVEKLKDIAQMAKDLAIEISLHGARWASQRMEALTRGLSEEFSRWDIPGLRQAFTLLYREIKDLRLGRPSPMLSRNLLYLWQKAESLETLIDKGQDLSKTWETTGIEPEPSELERVIEVPLFEVARRSLQTKWQERVEESFFVDLNSGQILREHVLFRPNQGMTLFRGPFPRYIHGHLIGLYPGYHPRRIRLLQHTLIRGKEKEALEKLFSFATTSFEVVLERLKQRISQNKNFPWIWILLAPKEITISPQGVILKDKEGYLLPLGFHEEPFLAATFCQLVKTGQVKLIFSRITFSQHVLNLIPLGVLLEIKGERIFRRL